MKIQEENDFENVIGQKGRQAESCSANNDGEAHEMFVKVGGSDTSFVLQHQST